MSNSCGYALKSSACFMFNQIPGNSSWHEVLYMHRLMTSHFLMLHRFYSSWHAAGTKSRCPSLLLHLARFLCHLSRTLCWLKTTSFYPHWSHQLRLKKRKMTTREPTQSLPILVQAIRRIRGAASNISLRARARGCLSNWTRWLPRLQSAL